MSKLIMKQLFHRQRCSLCGHRWKFLLPSNVRPVGKLNAELPWSHLNNQVKQSLMLINLHQADSGSKYGCCRKGKCKMWDTDENKNTRFKNKCRKIRAKEKRRHCVRTSGLQRLSRLPRPTDKVICSCLWWLIYFLFLMAKKHSKPQFSAFTLHFHVNQGESLCPASSLSNTVSLWRTRDSQNCQPAYDFPWCFSLRHPSSLFHVSSIHGDICRAV